MTTSDDIIAAFGNPPVVETVLGVQFERIPEFTGGHFGWFWKNYLGEEWTHSADAPPLMDQFERFEVRSIATKLMISQPAERLQIIHKNDDRVIQIQNTRFLYNWRKRLGNYVPHSERVVEFLEDFQRFQRFLNDVDLRPPKVNQWEVTYFNHIPSGDLWTSPREWHQILPGLLHDWQGVPGFPLERFSGEWHHEIEPHLGRLHITLKHGTSSPPENAQLLVLDLTARGPLRNSDGNSLEEGFGNGRRAIVESFLAMTSESIRKNQWKQEV